MLKFGLVLTPSHSADSDPVIQLGEHQRITQLAAELDFDVLLTGQHFATPTLRFFQPIPYLASLARFAGDMRLATGILILPLLHPLAVAEEIATLDALSGGKAVLGVGLGYSRPEAELFGIPWKGRTTRFEHSIGLIRGLLAGESVHAAEHWNLDGVRSSTLPVQDRLPIWIGAQAEPSVRRAARLADAWYAPPFPSHRELVELYDNYVNERRLHGLDLPSELPIRREVFLAPSHEEAAQLAERVTASRYETYSKWGLDLGDGFDSDWWDSRFVLGTPEQVTEQLATIIERVPMSHLVLRMTWPDQPISFGLEQLSMFGEHVLPELQRHVSTEGTDVGALRK